MIVVGSGMKRTVLDELLLAICYVEVALRTAVEDVACSIPAVGKGFIVKVRPVPIAWENVWSFQKKLAGLRMFMISLLQNS